MSTDETRLQDRLARRFDDELARAQHDYPTLGLGRMPAASRGRTRARSPWPRLASVVVVAAFIVAAFAGIGLLDGPRTIGGGPEATAPTVPASSATREAIPTTIAGARVYRAADKASFPADGSFLLGGVFTRPELVPPCAMRLGVTAADEQLIPYCYVLKIDGLALAPKSAVDEPNGELVVARVHVADPAWPDCSTANQETCKTSIVADEVVWRAAGTATPTPAPTAERSGVGGPSVGPTVAIVLGEDGVPTAIGGSPVLRAASLGQGSFLLGGILGVDSSCVAEAGASVDAATCGYTVDGVKTGSRIGIPASLVGRPVVVRVLRAIPALSCPPGPCPGSEPLVTILELVWSGAPAAPSLAAAPPIGPGAPSVAPSSEPSAAATAARSGS